MKIKDILFGVKFKSNSKNLDLEISSLKINSSECEVGSLFFCLKGQNFDGKDFVKESIENGAVAIVCSKKIKHLNILQIICKDVRESMCLIAKNFYDSACDKLKIIAITGTNGKTTTSFLIKNVLESFGKKVGLIGTNQTQINKIILPSVLTTPDPIELHFIFKQMVDFGCEYCVMEASAHAIFLKKLTGIKFEVCALTNITQDHLDFFKTFENYRKTKISLFNKKQTKQAIINADDSSFVMFKNLEMKKLTYGTSSNVNISASIKEETIEGTKFLAKYNNQSQQIFLPLPGDYNVSNALACLGVCLLLDFNFTDICENLEKCKQVDGRFNLIKTNLDCHIIIDYAHTPDGLLKVLLSLKKLCKARLICVFGCGGNRDKDKRPKMGKIASEYADFSVITSDNPRDENPNDIIAEIKQGFIKNNFFEIADRKEAIKYALNFAQKDDIVLIAGKGHENYQEILKERKHFSDTEVVNILSEQIVKSKRGKQKNA